MRRGQSGHVASDEDSNSRFGAGKRYAIVTLKESTAARIASA